jgi:hypothetical protein
MYQDMKILSVTPNSTTAMTAFGDLTQTSLRQMAVTSGVTNRSVNLAAIPILIFKRHHVHLPLSLSSVFYTEHYIYTDTKLTWFVL